MSDASSNARRFVAGGLAFLAGLALAWLMPHARPDTAPTTSVVRERSARDAPFHSRAEYAPRGSTARHEADCARLAIDYAEIDPERAARFARDSISPGPARQETLEGIAVAWARTDPVAAATWARNIDEGTLNLILYPWFDQEPEAVRAWTRGIASASERDRLWVQLARWQTEKDPAGAGAFVAEISDDALRTRSALTLVRRWARDDFDLAGEWALRTAAPALRGALVNELAAIAAAQTDVPPP